MNNNLRQQDKPEFFFGYGKIINVDLSFTRLRFQQKRHLHKQSLFLILPKQYQAQNKGL